MADVEKVVKSVLMLSVAGFGVYAAYKFMESQGWWGPPTTLTLRARLRQPYAIF